MAATFNGITPTGAFLMSSHAPNDSTLQTTSLKIRCTAWVVRLAIRCIGSLPLNGARALGAAVGRFSLWRNSRMVQTTQQNIAYCLPELSTKEQQALLRASVIETGKLAFETATVWTRSPQWVSERILKVTGGELLEAAMARQQGVLILAPHIGNWEVVNYFLASHGEVTNMYKPPKKPGMDAILQSCRTRCGARLVPTDRKGLMAILKVLKTGGISGILPDQTPKDDNSGLFAPFMGRQAFTMTLAHKLIHKSGCLPLFAYAKRIEGGFHIVIEPAPQAISGADEQAAAQALSEGIERCVRAIPSQYQWEYKRFRKQPNGEHHPY